MINKILRRLKLKEPETYKNYKNDLEVYFKTLDITYNEAESNLKNKLGDDILFFKNTRKK